MLRLAGRHFRSNVVAYLALFVALGGVAGAQVALFTGSQIVDESLTDADIKNGSLSPAIGTDAITAAKLASGSVVGGIGGDVLDNSITGADVLETSLGKIGDADKLDGLDSSVFGRQTDAYFAGASAVDIDPSTDVVSTTVTPGEFMVLTRVVLTNLGSARSYPACTLFWPNGTSAADQASIGLETLPDKINTGNMTLLGYIRTFMPQETITVRCGGATTTADARLVALRIDRRSG